jgi:periplasmic divalent cation tolerance protein
MVAPAPLAPAAAEVVVMLCTAPSLAVAEALARSAVEARVAACVNLIDGVRSVYRWEGAVCSEPEVQLLFKTTRERAGALREFIEREHPYEVPEILALPVDSTLSGAPYLKFVRESV